MKLSLICFLLLSSCNSMKEKSCSAEQARQDVFSGKKLSQQLQILSQKCGPQFDSNAYTQEYASALTEFCTEAQGFAFAANGEMYQDTCPQESGFLNSFSLGKQVFEKKERKSFLQKEVFGIEARLQAEDISYSESKRLRYDLRKHQNEIRQIRDEIQRLKLKADFSQEIQNEIGK